MEWMIEKELSYSRLVVTITRLGADYHVVVQGGEKPHIGCVVLAIPRPSLTGDGSVSVTSSVLNVTGHKDEELCRCLAEMLARKKNAVTVCTGGFHVDHIQKEQIAEVTEVIREIEKELGQLQ